jgi:hypothetical protein
MYCQHCGTQLADGATLCQNCGKYPLIAQMSAPGRVEQDPAMRLLLPVGRSVWAVLAGYAGLFAVLVFPAPIALLLGILAMRDINRHPEKFGKGRATFAIVMGLLGSLLLAFFVVMMIVESNRG